MEKIRIGVSRCLLGDRVRYDGRDKRDPLVAGTLAEQFELMPVCPEVEFGLPVPREKIELQGDPENPRLIALESSADLTGSMLTWCAERVEELKTENLRGFIFKSKSPSCGLVFQEKYQGMFSRAFMESFPEAPVIEAESLQDFEVRENFIARILKYRETC